MCFTSFSSLAEPSRIWWGRAHQRGLHPTPADGSSLGSSFSCSLEPTSSAVTSLHPLLSLMHPLMMPSLALTHLLIGRSCLSGHIPSPLSAEPPKRKEDWQQTALQHPSAMGELGKCAFLSANHSLCIVCNGETIRVAQSLLLQGEGLTALLSPVRCDASEHPSLSSSFPHWASPCYEMIVLNHINL